MPALRNVQHEHFAQAVAAGALPWRAYQAHRPNCAVSTATSSGYRLAAKPHIKQRIAEIQQDTAKALDGARVASKQRLLEMLTDIVFTAPSSLDETSPMVQEVSQTVAKVTVKRKHPGKENEAKETTKILKTKIKMVSKTFAIRQLALMMGYNAPIAVDGEIRVKGLREFINSIRKPGLPREIKR